MKKISLDRRFQKNQKIQISLSCWKLHPQEMLKISLLNEFSWENRGSILHCECFNFWGIIRKALIDIQAKWTILSQKSWKIKMEKLVELLNEYEIEREEKIDSFKDKEKPLWERYIDCTNDFTFEPTDSKMNWEVFSWDTAHSVIVSKSYGFIARLVEKDKINSTIWFENYNGWTLSFKRELVSKKHENIIKTHTTLMILSIQDNPLKFLVSLLK